MQDVVFIYGYVPQVLLKRKILTSLSAVRHMSTNTIYGKSLLTVERKTITRKQISVVVVW